MVAFLAGVSGLAAAWLVAVESNREPELVLILRPRAMEKIVMAPCGRPGIVMKSPVQEVGSYLNRVFHALSKRIKPGNSWNGLLNPQN